MDNPGEGWVSNGLLIFGALGALVGIGSVLTQDLTVLLAFVAGGGWLLAIPLMVIIRRNSRDLGTLRTELADVREKSETETYDIRRPRLVPLMTDNGLTAAIAGRLFGGMILLSVPVRLLAGVVADQAPIRVLPIFLAVLLALEAVSIASFALVPSFATMLVVVVALGIGAGAPTLVVLLLCAHLFGEDRFATVQGALMFLQVPGTMVAPIIAGLAHDWTGSYQIAVAIFSIALGAAALAMMCVRVPVLAQRN